MFSVWRTSYNAEITSALPHYNILYTEVDVFVLVTIGNKSLKTHLVVMPVKTLVW